MVSISPPPNFFWFSYTSTNLTMHADLTAPLMTGAIVSRGQWRRNKGPFSQIEISSERDQRNKSNHLARAKESGGCFNFTRHSHHPDLSSSKIKRFGWSPSKCHLEIRREKYSVGSELFNCSTSAIFGLNFLAGLPTESFLPFRSS